MNWGQMSGLVWLLACFLPFLFIQRWLHFEIQAIFLILTRRPQLALGLFSLLFFPGVFLHESSHYVAARLLRVPTGRFSLLPQGLPDGRLRLGYVETAQADLLRDALIGTAPHISGGLVTALIGIYRLDILSLTQGAAAGDWSGLLSVLAALPVNQPDFWLWFYVAFAVSSTMLPSESDRRAWLPLLLVLTGLIGFAILAGAGPWLMIHMAPLFNQALQAVALVFEVSLGVHIVLVIPAFICRWLLSRFTGLKVR